MNEQKSMKITKDDNKVGLLIIVSKILRINF